jgi:hypothetical protein
MAAVVGNTEEKRMWVKQCRPATANTEIVQSESACISPLNKVYDQQSQILRFLKKYAHFCNVLQKIQEEI